MALHCIEIGERHLERAADLGVQMMHLAGEAMRRQPLGPWRRRRRGRRDKSALVWRGARGEVGQYWWSIAHDRFGFVVIITTDGVGAKGQSFRKYFCQLQFTCALGSACCSIQSHGTILSNHHPEAAQPVRSGQRSVYFGRLLDKTAARRGGQITRRLAGGTRHDDERQLDWRTCLFLKIDYAVLEVETLKGDKTDAELLEWAFQHGRRPDEQGNRSLECLR